ncbi:hypothetical protein ACFL2F_02180 [Myxococcota bacterium]
MTRAILRFLPACLLSVLLVGSAARAEEEPKEDSGRGTFFRTSGFGAGSYFRTDYDGGKVDNRTFSRFAIGFDTKLGANIGDYFSVYLYSALAINDFALAEKFARWVFKDDGYVLFKAMFLMWFIPMAVFADSHAVVGPGIAWHVSPSAPSFYIEAGGGFSSMQSYADDSYIFGFAVFSGLGMEITEDVGFGVRVMWSPPAFHSKWTSNDDHIISLIAVLEI